MELEFTKLKFQPGKCFLNGTQVYYTRVPRQYTSCNFLFFPSHIIASLSFSLPPVSLTHTVPPFLTLALLSHLDQSSSVPHLPQSLISLSAFSLCLFYLPRHRVIPYLLLNKQRSLNGGDKQRHSIRKQGKLNLFYNTYL